MAVGDAECALQDTLQSASALLLLCGTGTGTCSDAGVCGGASSSRPQHEHRVPQLGVLHALLEARFGALVSALESGPAPAPAPSPASSAVLHSTSTTGSTNSTTCALSSASASTSAAFDAALGRRLGDLMHLVQSTVLHVWLLFHSNSTGTRSGIVEAGAQHQLRSHLSDVIEKVTLKQRGLVPHSVPSASSSTPAAAPASGSFRLSELLDAPTSEELAAAVRDWWSRVCALADERLRALLSSRPPVRPPTSSSCSSSQSSAIGQLCALRRCALGALYANTRAHSALALALGGQGPGPGLGAGATAHLRSGVAPNASGTGGSSSHVLIAAATAELLELPFTFTFTGKSRELAKGGAADAEDYSHNYNLWEGVCKELLGRPVNLWKELVRPHLLLKLEVSHSSARFWQI